MSFGDFLSILPHLPTWVPVGWLIFGGLLWLVAYWIARLSLKHPPHRKAVAGWLRYPRYTQLYRWACQPIVEWFWRRFCDPDVSERAKWSAQAKGALTTKLYDKALLFAVAYPIFAAVGYWLWTGNAATIGSVEIIGAQPSPTRLFTLGPIAISIFSLWFKHHLLVSQRKGGMPFNRMQNFIIQNLEWIGLVFALAFTFTGPHSSSFTVGVALVVTVALASTVIFTGAFAVALAFTVALALALASTIGLAFKDAISGAGGSVLAGVFAVALAFTVAVAAMKLPPRAYYALHALCMCAMICALISYLPWADLPYDFRSTFVFIGVFPLINGFFDWLSYGVTLSLLRRGQSRVWPFLWGLIDLLVACVLFLLLGITLVVVLHGLDQLAGGELVDLPALLGGVYSLKDGDWSQSWALFMVFSTMVPTGLHVLISLVGLQGFLPAPLRRKLAGWIEVDAPSPLSQAVLPMVLGVVWAAPIVAGCAVIWALIQWGKPLLGGFFQGYFNLLMWVAQWGGVV